MHRTQNCSGGWDPYLQVYFQNDACFCNKFPSKQHLGSQMHVINDSVVLRYQDVLVISIFHLLDCDEMFNFKSIHLQ